jgi:hypothetical protein
VIERAPQPVRKHCTEYFLKNGVFWVTTQKTPFFIVIAVKTSNLTEYFLSLSVIEPQPSSP